MPRRKRLPHIPDFIGTARNADKMVVQKSNPLLSLAETNLTLPELKILDAYLSRIDSHNPEKRYVRFEKGELEQLLGVTQIKKEDLSKRIDNLFQVITIRDEHKPRSFTKIALFAKAVCDQDENGQWQVDLACSAEAMEYVFNVENLRYLKYRLKNVIDLTSRYSYILYLYLATNRFRKSWEIDLEELKQLLRCNAERYAQYKFFGTEVLKKCHKELTEKTDIKYTYEPVRIGRRVIAIRFTLATQSDDEMYEQLTIDDGVSIHQQLHGDDLLWSAVSEFSDEEFEQIKQVLVVVGEDKLPANVPTGSIELQRYHYLKERMAAMDRAAAKKPIKDRFAYFLKMLKTDAGIR